MSSGRYGIKLPRKLDDFQGGGMEVDKTGVLTTRSLLVLGYILG